MIYTMWQLVGRKEPDWLQDVATALEIMAVRPPFTVIRTGIRNEQVIAALRKTGVPIEEDNRLGNQFWFGFEEDPKRRSDWSGDQERQSGDQVPTTERVQSETSDRSVGENVAVRTRRKRKA